MNAFIITFRESLEAGVIVGLLMSILASLDSIRHAWRIWFGVGLGVVTSFLTYLGFTYLGNGFEGAAEEIYEGVLMISAAGLITHMTFWMRAQGHKMRTHLHDKVHAIITSGSVWMMSLIAFLSVVREGVETVIFFSALEIQSGGWSQAIFGMLGIMVALIISILIWKGSKKVDIRSFFQISGFLLLVVSGGLLAHGIVELQEAHILPVMVEHLYDLSFILSESSYLGSFLKALFGYDADPSLLAFLGYLTYITITLQLYTKKD